MNSAKVAALKAHVAVNVRSVEASLEFYRKLFGIEPCKVRRGYAKFDVSNPPLNFTLNEVPFTDAGALSHLGIQVASTEDVLAIRRYQLSVRRGARIYAGQRRAKPPGASTAFASLREYVTGDDVRRISWKATARRHALQDKTWVRDPDGNEWEVFVVLEDNLPEKQSQGAACCAPAATPAESCCTVQAEPCCTG